ncbi:hypothetical protein D6D15_06950 [Aureobasidium pullulans]|uniref:Nucleoside phosphorylase domain-containing protein n=1 Tax=Aureobasidium pullulans TaxID=5580 RepID=A0A4S9B2X8_AURPU|nr:hypothetical protein D6D15_06950 [Aureobasidium pullulans]
MASSQQRETPSPDDGRQAEINRADQYTIGWICALPIELAAAVKMLDVEHQRLPPPPGDDNSYRFGRIGDHNIVIGCLPSGRTGFVSASSVATQMMSAFRQIRVGLMVGIGGGVPSEDNDVRLGDIVVSHPNGQHGGVAQYDFGKARPDGILERIGSLNAPPNALLTALTDVRAAEEMDELNIVDYLSRLTDRLPPYAYPSKLTDCLYQSWYSHDGGRNCIRCDSENSVVREKRSTNGPRIHYGTIASGNMVMKDAIERDQISQALGGVLCFEMEAAGLMNKFPCLVIRGISDYSDSHKNDGWQRYAAATAAAFAKDLLYHLATTRINQIDPISQAMKQMASRLIRNSEMVERTNQEIGKTIQQLMILCASSLRCLVTSRKESDIWKSLQSVASCVIDIEPAIKEDVAKLVAFALQQYPIRRWGDTILALIATKLLDAKERRFRWTDLQIKRLCACPTEDDLLIALDTIPESLEEAYHQALATIPSTLQERVRKILIWLASSFREMTSREIAAVVSFPFVDDVLKICTSLLVTVIDGDTHETIKLAHFTVKEFLIVQQSYDESLYWYKFTAQLAHCCITDQIIHYVFPSSISFPKALRPYAEAFWLAHARQNDATTDWAETQLLVDCILKHDNILFKNWLRANHPAEACAQSPLYYASLLGLEVSVMNLWRELLPGGNEFSDFDVKIAMDLKLRLAVMLHIGAIRRWKRLKSRRKCLVGWDNCRSSETLIPHPIHGILVLPR